MKFNDITSRLTGISIPVFGIPWTPPASERDAAKRVVTFLENRRALYNPSDLEMPEHCVMSVMDIRCPLTEELQKIDGDDELAKQLQPDPTGRCSESADFVRHRRRDRWRDTRRKSR